MKVFLDTNVLIDFLTGRPGKDEAAIILSGGEYGNFKLCASILTFANIAYILRKLPKEEMINSLRELSKIIKVLKMDERQLKASLDNPFADLEDTLQYQCANAAGADLIVTNNIKHFAHYPIKVMTSVDFVKSINEN